MDQKELWKGKTMRFMLYLLRWQLSTPILYLVLRIMLPYTSELCATIVANLIGGCVFYFVDREIFRGKNDRHTLHFR